MKPKVMPHCATYVLANGGFLHVDRAIMPIMVPEYSPTELEELRLKRDIDAIVKRDCPREKEYDDMIPEPPRKIKGKRKLKASKRKPKFIATSIAQA